VYSWLCPNPFVFSHRWYVQTRVNNIDCWHYRGNFSVVASTIIFASKFGYIVAKIRTKRQGNFNFQKFEYLFSCIVMWEVETGKSRIQKVLDYLGKNQSIFEVMARTWLVAVPRLENNSTKVFCKCGETPLVIVMYKFDFWNYPQIKWVKYFMELYLTNKFLTLPEGCLFLWHFSSKKSYDRISQNIMEIPHGFLRPWNFVWLGTKKNSVV